MLFRSVFILDVDLEAPGLINFFGITEDGISKNGIVEYIKNKEYDPDTSLGNEYVYEVSRKYSGDGSLFMMPAGNLSEKNDRDHFLEGLSRLDFFGTLQFFHKFNELLLDVESVYAPDVILVDSRTGFNDIYGLLINKFSDIVVGLFGNDVQNEPGLFFFLDTFQKNKSLKSLVLVNSIISKSISKSTNSFREKVENYLKDTIEDIESLPAVPIYGFVRNPILEDIGTDQEDLDDFITLVKNKTLNDYVECFEKILCLVNDFQGSNIFKQENEIKSECQKNKEEELFLKEFQFSKYPKKEHILQTIYNNFPEPYAEDIEFSSEFLKDQFYIRKSMENIFIQDKFILLGGKGTGKTAFYSALQNSAFFKNLQKRAQKEHQKFINIKGVSLPQELTVENSFFFDVAGNFVQTKIDDPDFFYRRFWIVYIWLVISGNGNKFQFKPSLPVFNFDNSATSAKKFIAIIENDDVFQKVEEDILRADKELNSLDINCILSFDQLDKVVKPNLWSKAITPLINYCSTNRFERIFPKLFIRRDLFNKIGNITNKNQLERRSVNLEWSIDEIFDFFFKVIFSTAKEQFLSYAKDYDNISNEIIKKITATINKSNSYNQLNSDQYLLKPLVEVFFGKHADPMGTMRFGETYDWFYSNLRNADDTISLRPFLDLILFSLEKAKRNTDQNSCYFPAIYPGFFNAEARSYAVERHLSDLAGEEGNELLKVVIDDIRNDKVPKEYKVTSLLNHEFEAMAKIIIQNNSFIDFNSSDVEKILELNGITASKFIPGGGKVHSFAFLYKYYLGLKSPTRGRRRYQPKRR